MADYDVPAAALDWLPDGSDVAALIRARTKDPDGRELGAFTDRTRPTAGQVDELVSMAAQAVHARIGWTIPDDRQEEARRLIALRAALNIELSYFPEQVTSGRSAYEPLKELYDEGIAAMLDALRDNTPNEPRVDSLLVRSGLEPHALPAPPADAPGFGAYSLVSGAAFGYSSRPNPYGYELGDQHANGPDLPPDGGDP